MKCQMTVAFFQSHVSLGNVDIYFNYIYPKSEGSDMPDIMTCSSYVILRDLVKASQIIMNNLAGKKHVFENHNLFFDVHRILVCFFTVELISLEKQLETIRKRNQ